MGKRRVVLAGGGTAGHVNPLLAVAEGLRRDGWEVDILGTEEGLESVLVPAQNFPLTTVPKVPLPRKPSPQLFTLPSRLQEAKKKAAAVIRGANAVVGFGGYVSVPAYRAAKELKVPVVIHEQNAKPGLANRMAARYAAAVGVTFPGTNLTARRGITEVTGLPLRQPVAQLVRERSTLPGAENARAQAAKKLGLDPAQRTLLITGGSLGAQHLNEAALKAAPALPSGAQVIHLTGRGKDGPVREGLPDEIVDRWAVLDYMAEMELALATADLVLCRSGAGTVAELSALGIPAFYVPLPIGNGEQELNARDVVDAGGALLVRDGHFNDATVRAQVFPLLMDGAALGKMSDAARRASVGDGTGPVMELVYAVAKNG